MLERVRQAAEFCVASGLECFRVEDEALSIEVRRSGGFVPAAHAVREPLAETASELAVPNGAVAPLERPATILRAEFVGVVRFARPPVYEGTTLHEDRELAYVESLGVRNPIRCGAPGRVASVFVSDGQPVEYGQPLFAIEPA